MGFLKQTIFKIQSKKQEKDKDLSKTFDSLPQQEGKDVIKEITSYTDNTRIAQDEEDTLIMQKKSVKKIPASLLLLHGPKDLIGQSWPLLKPITTVGRSHGENDIPINYKSLSRSHFKILKEKQNFYLVDLKSTNKTYLNDKVIKPHQKRLLQNNSYIRTSHLIFKFLAQGSVDLFSSLQMLSKTQTDPLTGAGNRQLLKIKGSEYFFSERKLSLIVFDIDNFKIINDNFGHLAGDTVLQTLSRYVLEIIRKGDMFIRYGGDEFCIFTPQSLSVAQGIADRIQQKIQTNNFIFEGKNISLDISIGISEKSPSDKTYKDIYCRADKISYQQKQRKKLVQKESSA